MANLLTAAMLDQRWSRAPHSLVDGIVAAAPAVLPKYGIDTPLRLAHFMAQASVECASGTAMEPFWYFLPGRAPIWNSDTFSDRGSPGTSSSTPLTDGT